MEPSHARLVVVRRLVPGATVVRSATRLPSGAVVLVLAPVTTSGTRTYYVVTVPLRTLRAVIAAHHSTRRSHAAAARSRVPLEAVASLPTRSVDDTAHASGSSGGSGSSGSAPGTGVTSALHVAASTRPPDDARVCARLAPQKLLPLERRRFERPG
ncbi:MAG TPA: hypothetical protein VFA05_04530 [Gaiellaceae bacterium]|nr:hypothetical protein [Gaiellaceae bacterium]